MSNVTELTTASTNTYLTGAWLPTANSVGVTINAIPTFMSVPNFQTGSWEGLGNTQNVIEISTGSVHYWHEGTWKGVDYSDGIIEVLTENHDRFVAISENDPMANQGFSAAAWDPFPTPPVPVEPEIPQRDTTRYRKTYSSQRRQPQRIRLIKK